MPSTVSLVPSKGLPEVGYLRTHDVLKIFPICRTTLYKLIKNGLFPAPVKLGPKLSAWDVQTIREFMDQARG